MTRHRAIVALALCLVALVALLAVGCAGGASSGGSSGSTSGSTSGGTGGATAGGTTITEQNFAFSPSTATVKVGDTVTFTNNDSTGHNVTIDGQELGVQNQGESKTWKASKAGKFPFSCVIHPSMTGEITVQ